MSNSSKIWVGGAVFIILIIAVCAVIVRFSSRGDLQVLFGFAGDVELKKITEMDIGADTELQITAYSEDIYFYESDSSKLVIKEYYWSDSNKMLGNITQSDNKVSFTANKINNIVLFGFHIENEKIEVYLPEGYVSVIDASVRSGGIHSDLAYTGDKVSLLANSGEVTWDMITAETILLEVTSGEIDVEAMDGGVTAMATSGEIRLGKVAGSLDIRVNSGNIEADEITGDITAEVSSGNIEVRKVEGFVKADSMSGNIRLFEITGGADVSASSGNINLTLTEIKDNVDVRVNSGNITIDIPENSEFTFQADTNSGDIKTSFDDNHGFDINENSVEGVMGNNPQYIIKAKTTSGNIRVNA